MMEFLCVLFVIPMIQGLHSNLPGKYIGYGYLTLLSGRSLFRSVEFTQ